MSDYEDTPEYPRDQQLTSKKKRQLRNECSKDERQKHRKQQYRHEWEMDPKFKTWLRPEKDDKFRAVRDKANMCSFNNFSTLKYINYSTHLKRDGYHYLLLFKGLLNSGMP
ncbi:hypothetical protein ACI65C_013234 [Semiaphis heraclei]